MFVARSPHEAIPVEVAEVTWALVERPDGSSADVEPQSQMLIPDRPGLYVVSRRIDRLGVPCSNPEDALVIDVR
ncbi:MAG: hypothetical protein AAFX99_26420 [Myxococcota bacterium]